MKRKSNENSVSELIELFMNQYGLGKKYGEFKLLQAWSQMMGPMIANRTTDLRIVNDVLIVQLNSASLKSELSYAKTKIVERLNEAAGKVVIQDIIFQ